MLGALAFTLAISTPVCAAPKPKKDTSAASTSTLSTPTTSWTLTAADYQSLTADGFTEEYRPIMEAIKRSEFDRALSAIDAVRKANKRPRYVERLYFLEGVAQTGKGATRAAEPAFNKALELRQGMPDALYFLAFLRFKQEQPAEAYKLLSEAQWFLQPTAHSSVPIEAVNYRVSMFAAQAGETKRAEDSLQAALAANPQYVPALTAKADREAQKGNRPETIKRFKDAIAKAPQDPDLKVRYAKALLSGADRSLNQEDLSEAERVLQEVVAGTGISKETRTSAQLALSKTFVEEGKLDEAEAAIKTALKASPDNAELTGLLDQLSVERRAMLSLTPSPTPQ